MKPVSHQFELSQLRNFVKEKLTPTLISAVERWRGDIGFNPTILAKTGDRNLAYHGLDCCLQAAQIAKFFLEKEQRFGLFDLVSPLQNKHHLLRHQSDEEDPIIIDPSIRQHASHPSMDLIGQLEFEKILRKKESGTALSDEEMALARAISKYIRQSRNYSQQDVERIHNAMLDVAETTDAVFVGHKPELEAQIKNIFLEQIEPALQFSRVLTDKMIEDALQCYVDKPQQWQKTSREFIDEARLFASPSNSPLSPEADPILKMIREIERN